MGVLKKLWQKHLLSFTRKALTQCKQSADRVQSESVLLQKSTSADKTNNRGIVCTEPTPINGHSDTNTTCSTHCSYRTGSAIQYRTIYSYHMDLKLLSCSAVIFSRIQQPKKQA
jgi:hypothetical protein